MSSDGSGTHRYRFVPGIEWVQTDENSVIFRSAASKATINGAHVSSFVSNVVPVIDGGSDLATIARSSSVIPLDELQSYIRELVEARLLIAVSSGSGREQASPFIEALSAAGRDHLAVRERITKTRFAVLGLESTGAAIARELARWGVHDLVLADPAAPRPDDPAAIGVGRLFRSRQDGLREELISAHPAVNVSTPLVAWSASGVRAIADTVDVIIAAVDRDFAVVAQWVNRAAFEANKVAAFVTLDVSRAVVGPIVYPGETACYMCYRMRAIACEDDYFASMAFEELRDRKRETSSEREPTFLPLVPMAAGLITGEIAKTLTAVGRHALAGKVIELDGLGGLFTEHDVLRQPSCPTCGKKKLLNPDFPPLDDMSEETPGPDLSTLAPRLVDSQTGIVRSLNHFRKALGEPRFPVIVRAELSNFRYHRDKADAFQVASGKGATERLANVSALGEAVERYSAGIWPDSDVPRMRREEIDGLSLDPRELVLYEKQAYRNLPYSPWTDDAVAGWVWGRDIASGKRIAVPAQPTLMSYSLQAGEANLCQVTSNGLAAGPTLAEAALRAIYEVIERDAFISTWLLRLPPQAVDIESIPLAEVRDLATAYARRGVTMELYRLRTTMSVHAFVGLGIAQSESDLPAVVVGLGASHDAIAAARSALSEVAQVRPGLKYRLLDPEVLAHRDAMHKDSNLVEALEDHDLYYSSLDQLSAFDFLRGTRPVDIREWAEALPGGEPISPRGRLARLAEEAADDGAQLIVVDLSPPDMLKLGLHTVRGYLSGYQPIYFGQKEIRIADARLNRLSQRFLGKVFDKAFVNPKPHPVA